MGSTRTSAGHERRERLQSARLMLIFTPEVCPPGRDPLAQLEAALPHVDLVQVRIKEAGLGLAPARATHDWTLRVLERVAARSPGVLVLVNDRPDVAGVLAERGVAGVHVGADDAPPELARALLGPDALIGLSTHDAAQVVAAQDQPVDYLGFGPIHPSSTRPSATARALGPEAAWIAASSSGPPIFPIGGIDLANAQELAPVGRAAVCAAILRADDPARAAAELRALLGN